MKSKHTPGPWRLSEKRIAVKGSTQQGYTGELVATTSPHNSIETREADARLIAAAPDLLAACEAVIDAAGLAGVYGSDEWAVMVRAAIAKAKDQLV